MSRSAASDVRSEYRRDVLSFHAFAVSDDRRVVLAALTEQAVAHFGRDRLMLSGLHVATSVSGPASVAYLATAEFSLPR